MQPLKPRGSPPGLRASFFLGRAGHLLHAVQLGSEVPQLLLVLRHWELATDRRLVDGVFQQHQRIVVELPQLGPVRHRDVAGRLLFDEAVRPVFGLRAQRRGGLIQEDQLDVLFQEEAGEGQALHLPEREPEEPEPVLLAGHIPGLLDRRPVLTEPRVRDEVAELDAPYRLYELVVADVPAADPRVQELLPKCPAEHVGALRDEVGPRVVGHADGAFAVAPKACDGAEHGTLPDAALASDQQRVPVLHAQRQPVADDLRGEPRVRRSSQREVLEHERAVQVRVLLKCDVATPPALAEDPAPPLLDVVGDGGDLPEPLHRDLALHVREEARAERVDHTAAARHDAHQHVLLLELEVSVQDHRAGDVLEDDADHLREVDLAEHLEDVPEPEVHRPRGDGGVEDLEGAAALVLGPAQHRHGLSVLPHLERAGEELHRLLQPGPVVVEDEVAQGYGDDRADADEDQEDVERDLAHVCQLLAGDHDGEEGRGGRRDQPHEPTVRRVGVPGGDPGPGIADKKPSQIHVVVGIRLPVQVALGEVAFHRHPRDRAEPLLRDVGNDEDHDAAGEIWDDDLEVELPHQGTILCLQDLDDLGVRV
mmetsp:Transcript_90623/g.256713  ORF Transcript_90623/g.256713 Transcript_90623/m.256713 type:complete len:594 (-) Transcript_90623:1062-2843(-)